MALAETLSETRKVGSSLSPATADPAGPLLAMSVDVEDWFHVENVRTALPTQAWDRQTLRVEHAMERMLEVMAQWNVRATCFVLGWVAERAPRLVQKILDAGHEVASHGFGHELVYQLEPASFRADVERSKFLLEQTTGQRVRGYRAPNFSITDWALPILQDVGFEYDSSYVPTTLRYHRYSRPEVLRLVDGSVSRHCGLVEVGVSCLPVGRHAFPWGGGAYFRLIPYGVFKRGIRRILRTGRPYVFYIHPWELDPAQPRVRGLSRSERLRHYVNLEKTESRWTSLLRDFTWTTIGDLVADYERREKDGSRLGALDGVDVGMRGTHGFDKFESRGQSYIGP